MGALKINYYLADSALEKSPLFLEKGLKEKGTAEKKRLNYYPFGSPMPGRNMISSPQYEHGYQGQFTEHDQETSLNAFELRMWDSRLARWTSTDPYGQFHSPYLGMGNNPVSGVDPDGGFWGMGPALSGALVGAVGGGIAGGIINGKNGVWQGALLGAALGAGIGHGIDGGFSGVGSALEGAGKSIGSFVGENAGAFAAGAASFLNGLYQGSQNNIYDTRTIKFDFTELDYLFAEGAGLNGTFHVKGTIQFSQSKKGTIATIFANGLTSVDGLGQVTFGGSAGLSVDGNIVQKGGFSRPRNLIYQTGTHPLGSVSFLLPRTGNNVGINLNVGYTLRTAEGRAAANMSRLLNIPILNSSKPSQLKQGR